MEDLKSILMRLAFILGVALFGLVWLKSAGTEANALESNGYFVELSDEYNGDIVYDGKPIVYEGK